MHSDGNGHVSIYPTMHYFGNPRHTQLIIAYMILTVFSGNSSENCIVGMLLIYPIAIGNGGNDEAS